jgi:hypothetical protein
VYAGVIFLETSELGMVADGTLKFTGAVSIFAVAACGLNSRETVVDTSGTCGTVFGAMLFWMFLDRICCTAVRSATTTLGTLVVVVCVFFGIL